MNQSARATLIDLIAELCQRYPNWRLGQLVANVAGWADQDVWNVEDEQLLQAARSHLQQEDPSIASAHSATPSAAR